MPFNIAVKDATATVDFQVVAADGVTGVTGLAPGSFTPKLYNPSNAEVSGSITVTVAELGDGWYRGTFTPNAVGVWALSETHATYGVFVGTIHVFAQLFDQLGPGVGVRTVRITVEDDVTSNPIADVTVQIFDTGDTTRYLLASTDANGQVNCSLNDGTYNVYLAKVGSYTFATPETLTVSDGAGVPDVSVTYTGTAFSPSAPPSPDMCTVYGWVRDVGYNAQAVTVSAHPVLADRANLDNDEQALPDSVSTTSDAGTGYWELSVLRSSAYAASAGLQFQFIIDDHEGPAVTVPDATSAALADLEA